MNIIHLIGNLGSDPKAVSDGTVAQVSLATSESYTKKGDTQKTTETTWHTVFFYGKTAETVLKYFRKGQKMAVTGRLKTNKFKDEKGVERTGHFIRGDEFEFVERADNNAPENVQENSASLSQTPAATAPSKPVTKTVSTKKTLVATVPTAPASHTEEDLNSFDDSDPTEGDDLPF